MDVYIESDPHTHAYLTVVKFTKFSTNFFKNKDEELQVSPLLHHL